MKVKEFVELLRGMDQESELVVGHEGIYWKIDKVDIYTKVFETKMTILII